MVRVTGFEPTASWSRIPVWNSRHRFYLRLALCSSESATPAPYPFHRFRSVISCRGSRCGSNSQFATRRTGLTLLNFIARSGGSFRPVLIESDWHKPDPLQFFQLFQSERQLIHKLSYQMAVFAIMSTTLKTGGQLYRNQPHNLFKLSVLINNSSLCIHYKRNVVSL